MVCVIGGEEPPEWKRAGTRDSPRRPHLEDEFGQFLVKFGKMSNKDSKECQISVIVVVKCCSFRWLVVCDDVGMVLERSGCWVGGENSC